jgi:DNA recombination protein RmuC
MEDYQRLQDAYEQADLSQIEQQLKQLETRIKLEGKSICSKYVNPPTTTDFAILFLPNEGLFAEVIRMPGLQDWLMRECKIIVCGPTYLHGLLNSLSMGFRTLAIEKKSTEVWNTLGVVKTQFGAFADLLENVKAKLIQSTNKIDQAATKARTIERKLKKVEALPASDVDATDEYPLRLLSLPDPETEDQEAA